MIPIHKHVMIAVWCIDCNVYLGAHPLDAKLPVCACRGETQKFVYYEEVENDKGKGGRATRENVDSKWG